MRITALEIQKKDVNRLSVFIEGQFAFGLTKDQCQYYQLEAGRQIPDALYETILDDITQNQAKNTALNYLTFKARSEKEMRDKLATKEYPLAVIDKTVDFLKRYNYINDTQYAQNYIRQQDKKLSSRRKITYDLQKKGIQTTAIDLGSAPDESEKAYQLLLKKQKKSIADLKEKRRLYQMLARRGFSYDTIQQAFTMLGEDSDRE